MSPISNESCDVVVPGKGPMPGQLMVEEFDQEHELKVHALKILEMLKTASVVRELVGQGAASSTETEHTSHACRNAMVLGSMPLADDLTCVAHNRFR